MLITPAQLAQIKAALKATTDTFYQEDVTIIQRTAGLDRFGEGQQIKETLTVLKGFLEYGDSNDVEATESTFGSMDLKKGTVSFHTNDLIAVGLASTDGVCVVKPESDLLEIRGIRHNITGVHSDGYLIDQNILCVMDVQQMQRNGLSK